MRSILVAAQYVDKPARYRPGAAQPCVSIQIYRVLSHRCDDPVAMVEHVGERRACACDVRGDAANNSAPAFNCDESRSAAALNERSCRVGVGDIGAR